MKGGPKRIDIVIGCNLQKYRLATGKSAQELGKDIGKSATQIQKYEDATNRIAVSTLLDISKALGVPMQRFWAAPKEIR